MTNGDPGETLDLHELPRLVLDPADLDVLELALGGGLSGPLELVSPSELAASAPIVLLTDGENTPLALFHADAPNSSSVARRGRVSRLRPRAMRVGPASDAELRRAADDVRPALAERPGHGEVLVLTFSDLPTLDDLARAHRQVAETRPEVVLWAAVVSSAPAPPRQPNDDAIVRAVMAARPADAIGLIVPAVVGAVHLRQVSESQPALMANYGATRMVNVTAGRDNEERARRAGAHENLESLFPPASAEEFARLRERVPLAHRGAVVLMTGLSGSGKSTVARALAERLEHEIEQPITLLDGDEVRQLLSSELGFDRHSRELNLRRVGYVAALLARSGGVAIAAPIAPFDVSRQEIRRRVSTQGSFFLLVHVATTLEVCEARDRKGLYAGARSGAIEDFTGISSPYETPADADVVIDTGTMTVTESVQAIFAALTARLAERAGSAR